MCTSKCSSISVQHQSLDYFMWQYYHQWKVDLFLFHNTRYCFIISSNINFQKFNKFNENLATNFFWKLQIKHLHEIQSYMLSITKWFESGFYQNLIIRRDLFSHTTKRYSGSILQMWYFVDLSSSNSIFLRNFMTKKHFW